MKKLHVFFLSLILIFGFATRLYKFNNPIADWHSWRQADTSSVSRMFVEQGFNLFVPTYQDISNIASGFENPHGYRFVEFPIYNSIVYFGYLFNNGVDERIARLVNILFTLGSVIFVYLISRECFL